MKQARAMVAMSGGVDSAVTALLLQQQGYDCAGATLKLTPPAATLLQSTKSCCNPEEIEQAKQIAGLLGISHTVIDASDAFCRHVVDYFVKTYLNGGTPNPCIVCNKTMKFGLLSQKSIELGYKKIATGHYAKVQKDPNGRFLLTVWCTCNP